MSGFVQQAGANVSFLSSDSWVILSPIEQSIKNKIEAVGVPLKDWDINIYRGILTGYNDAFIISTEKRNEILANCADESERIRTEDLIRPILRGRDIKRYSYDWADLWLIATFPSRKYDIEQYPAVKKYLLSFAASMLREAGLDWIADNHLSDFCYQKLAQTGQYIEIAGQRIRVSKEAEKARKKTSNKWFETQDSISYWEEFLQPKIVYREISTVMEAAIAPAGWYINNKLYMITGCGDAIEYVCCFLNSKLFTKAILCNANFGGGKGIDFLGQIKLPKFNTIVYGTKTTYDDNYFCNLFGLNADEQRFILSE